MSISIKKLAGASPEIIVKLGKLRITNSDQLLNSAATPAQRKDLAKQVGVNDRVILELANRADLSRVKGVAGVFSNLLETAGVDTVKELAMRRADNLYAKMVEVNRQNGLSKRTPAPSEVKGWVVQAKELPKTLSY